MCYNDLNENPKMEKEVWENGRPRVVKCGGEIY